MKKTVLIIGIIALVVVGGGIARWFTTANSTDNSVQPTPDSTDVLGSETSLTPWQTTSFSTQKPAWLRQVSAVENASSPIASYVLRATQKQDAQIAVSIAPLGTNALSESPAVRVRTMKPTEYLPTSLAGAPSGALVFTHQGTYETAVFWQHAGNSIAVVASGSGDQQADLDTALGVVLRNWRWGP